MENATTKAETKLNEERERVEEASVKGYMLHRENLRGLGYRTQELAPELGIPATHPELPAELERVKDQQFKTEAEFNKYLKEANFTLEEVTSRVRLQLLSQKIQDKITKSVSSVPDSDIENY